MSQPQEKGISQDIFCQDCGYNLRGLTGEVCPECGRSLAGLRSDVSQIPWIHRKEIGRFRAYWKTVWFVMFRQRQFCDEMVRPVSYADSQSFRRVTLTVVSIFLLSIILTSYAVLPTQFFRGSDLLDASYSAVFPVIVLYSCIVVWVVACTGLPSYFFHPKSIEIPQKNRAIALSYYACGPLALMGTPIIALDLAIALHDADEVLAILFVIFAVTLPIGPLAAWWLDLIHLSRRLLPQKPIRAVWVALMVPFLWLASGFLLLAALPALLMYPLLIYMSLNQ